MAGRVGGRPVLEVVRGVYGGILLIAPGRILVPLARAEADGVSLTVARLLGARHLVQAALLGSRPAAGRRLAGALVDGAHAASMVALARRAAEPGHRRLAWRNAGTASAFAVLEGGAAIRGLRHPPGGSA